MFVRVPHAMITHLSRLFTPTGNKRLNELVGFLLFVSAILLFLALASYNPLDPSLNTAATPSNSGTAANWIGVVGATFSDLLLQYIGIAVFLMPMFFGLLGQRWFRSLKVESPGAKTLGAFSLIVFASALMALLPWHWLWRSALPIEGLTGRIVGDALIHYFNVTGAYIVCLASIAVALYLSTAFSFGAVRLWTETRFAFVFAAVDRFQDWRAAREKAREQKEFERRKKEKAAEIAAQLVPARRPLVAPQPTPVLPETKSGIERFMEEQQGPRAPSPLPMQPAVEAESSEIAVSSRAEDVAKTKTVMPKMQGGYKLPSSALLHRPDERNEFDEEELKRLAQVLTEK